MHVGDFDTLPGHMLGCLGVILSEEQRRTVKDAAPFVQPHHWINDASNLRIKRCRYAHITQVAVGFVSWCLAKSAGVNIYFVLPAQPLSYLGSPDGD